MNVYQYSIQRSGSTLVYNILRWISPLLPYTATVTKGHGIPRPCVLPRPPLRPVNIDKAYIVITQRDPRDCIASKHRMVKGRHTTPQMTRDDIVSLSQKTAEEIDTQLLDIKPYKHVLWLRYENFVSNYEHIYDRLEKFFNIVIDKEFRKVITNHCSLSSMKKISDTIRRNDEDANTKMVHNHIGSGKVGLWKDLTPQSLHGLMNSSLKKVLNVWKYND